MRAPVGDRTPTHVHAEPGDRYSLCGLKDALPAIWVEAVDRHVKGYGMVVCPECAEAMK